MSENQTTTPVSGNDTKKTKLERLIEQKKSYEQRKKRLQAEAKRIKRIESEMSRKQRTGQLVALGLACEQMFLRLGINKDVYELGLNSLNRDIDKQRFKEIVVQIKAKREKAKAEDTE